MDRVLKVVNNYLFTQEIVTNLHVPSELYFIKKKKNQMGAAFIKAVSTKVYMTIKS